VSRQRIGEWLVQKGFATAPDVQRALEAAETTGTRLASQLLQLEVASEESAVEGLSVLLGVPGIDLSRSAINLESLALIPQEVAEIEHILPLKVTGEELLLAMADPHNARILEEVQLISGKHLVPYVALIHRLEKVISWAYEAASRGDNLWVGEEMSSDTSKETLAVRGVAPRRSAPPAPRPPEPTKPPPAASSGKPPQLKTAPPLPRNAQRDFPIDIEEGSLDNIEEEIGAVRARPSGRVVLVVDDEDDVLRLVRKALENKGFRVESASRGNEALARANDLLPDLVLLDANLPEVHGFDVCKKLKANPRFADIPIVLTTGIYRGWRFAEDAREAFGADDYLEKPFRLDDLLRRVELHLAKSVGEPHRNRDEAEKHYLEGLRRLEAGQPAEAAAAFEKSLALDAFDAKSHFQLARALQAAGDPYRAIASYERCVELRPDSFPALRSLAALYQQRGFRRKALEAWERAIPAAPDEATRAKIRNSLVSLF
jgi:DNA-binding response OmpR family regulator